MADDDKHTLDLSKKDLKKLEKRDGIGIQKLILDNNELLKLEHLDCFPDLEKLSAKNNCLSRMYGVSKLHYLVSLSLSHNNIISIEGLKELHSLTWLDLAGNKIKLIQNLQHNRNIIYLDLSDNNIESLGDLSHLEKLKTLHLRGNHIFNLQGASSYLPPSICILSLADNNLSDLNEISHLSSLTSLERLTINNNPCVVLTGQTVGFDYRPFVVNWCLGVRVLDNYVVTQRESLKAEWLFSQGKGRHFRPGEHIELIEYLAHVCPLTSVSQMSTEEEERLTRVLKMKRQHKEQLLHELSTVRGASENDTTTTQNPSQQWSLRKEFSQPQNSPSPARSKKTNLQNSYTDQTPRHNESFVDNHVQHWSNIHSQNTAGSVLHVESAVTYKEKNKNLSKTPPPISEQQLWISRNDKIIKCHTETPNSSQQCSDSVIELIEGLYYRLIYCYSQNLTINMIHYVCISINHPELAGFITFQPVLPDTTKVEKVDSAVQTSPHHRFPFPVISSDPSQAPQQLMSGQQQQKERTVKENLVRTSSDDGSIHVSRNQEQGATSEEDQIMSSEETALELPQIAVPSSSTESSSLMPAVGSAPPSSVSHNSSPQTDSGVHSVKTSSFLSSSNGHSNQTYGFENQEELPTSGLSAILLQDSGLGNSNVSSSRDSGVASANELPVSIVTNLNNFESTIITTTSCTRVLSSLTTSSLTSNSSGTIMTDTTSHSDELFQRQGPIIHDHIPYEVPINQSDDDQAAAQNLPESPTRPAGQNLPKLLTRPDHHLSNTGTVFQTPERTDIGNNLTESAKLRSRLPFYTDDMKIMIGEDVDFQHGQTLPVATSSVTDDSKTISEQLQIRLDNQEDNQFRSDDTSSTTLYTVESIGTLQDNMSDDDSLAEAFSAQSTFSDQETVDTESASSNHTLADQRSTTVHHEELNTDFIPLTISGNASESTLTVSSVTSLQTAMSDLSGEESENEDTFSMGTVVSPPISIQNVYEASGITTDFVYRLKNSHENEVGESVLPSANVIHCDFTVSKDSSATSHVVNQECTVQGYSQTEGGPSSSDRIQMSTARSSDSPQQVKYGRKLGANIPGLVQSNLSRPVSCSPPLQISSQSQLIPSADNNHIFTAEEDVEGNRSRFTAEEDVEVNTLNRVNQKKPESSDSDKNTSN
ncbi:centrosomal protein of 97 kDa-like [Limulus polyphemus]|uniref:Centrosomal protein of 97 kDa-like n=1 Tax=Limulus polyphemus TaxID=6850 RepID=A0ABM1TC65_LIMPO|nr:centrosomal protein of 97 kDa-like [Limulus polyphemus]